MNKRIFRLILIAQLVILPNLFLFSPQPSEWSFFKFNSKISFPIVIDAMDFIHPAINTDVLLLPKEKRQSRPLYIYGGHYLGEGICVLFEISGKTEFLNKLKSKMNPDMVHYFEQFNDPWHKVMAYYLGFVFVNFVILLGSAYLWLK